MNGEVTQGRLSAILVGEEADHGVSYMRRLSPFLALAAASLPIISRTVLVVASVFDPVDDGINLNTPPSGIMAALPSKQ